MKARTKEKTKILLLAGIITLSFMNLALWDHYRIEKDFTNTMNFLRYARLLSLYRNEAHAVIFGEKNATLENLSTKETIDRLKIETLKYVNYETNRGKNRIIFNDKGMTDLHNVNEHGGDLKLRSWFGFKKSIWVHCTGLATEGEMVLG